MSLPNGFGSDSDNTPPTQPTGQPTNWEARFKGMQTEYNTLRAQHEAVLQQLQAKDIANTSLAEENARLKMGMAEVAAKYEGQVAELKAAVGSTEGRLKEKELELGKATARLESFNKEQSVRRAMSSEFPELLPFVDSGYLRPFDAEGNPLEGDALKAHLTGFKSMLSGNVTRSLDDALAGTKPPAGQPAGTVPGAKTMDQLRDWLDQNTHLDADDPEWSKHHEAYIELVAKNQPANPLLAFQ